MNKNFRPTATPLVTVDPYFSIWSTTDTLNGGITTHWTGKPNSLTGIAQIDGEAFVFMGKVPQTNKEFTQTKLLVEPLSTSYTFEGGGIELRLKFTTPLLLSDLMLASRPVSYVSFSASSIDEKDHKVKIYFDASGELCVDNGEQEVLLRERKIGKDLFSVYMGNVKQEILSKTGDDLRIDWGYFYMAAPLREDIKYQTQLGNLDIRNSFIRSGNLDNTIKLEGSMQATNTIMALSLELGNVGKQAKNGYIMLAYDDIKSIEYFNTHLDALWKKDGINFSEMLIKASEEYDTIIDKCNSFDRELIENSIRAGGEKYSELISLAYRQAIGAHKAVAGPDGEVLFFSKECFSNGCMATVDVTYPSIPLFLLYNTELVKGMLRPIFKYAKTSEWEFDFAPHDVGCYPKANGQVYGNNELKYQMPVEECGNMLITMATICLRDKDAAFASENLELLTEWADYLVENGFDPGNQLCTDDFAGHLAHNCNLSVKAILGIASFGLIEKLLSNHEKYDYYTNIAKEMAGKWGQTTLDKDHHRLTFDGEGTWSLKYNMVWDALLNINIFDNKIKEREIAYYLTKQNKYGIPLDSRATYTKVDWIVWAASMAAKNEDFKALVEPIWDFVNESPSRVPFSDWYDTITSKQIGFQNRTVLGGMFIKLLTQEMFK